jgi:hypothetical protein
MPYGCLVPSGCNFVGGRGSKAIEKRQSRQPAPVAKPFADDPFLDSGDHRLLSDYHK